MDKTNKKDSHKALLMFEIGEIEFENRESSYHGSHKKTSKIKLFLWFGFWALVIMICC